MNTSDVVSGFISNAFPEFSNSVIADSIQIWKDQHLGEREIRTTLYM